MPARSLHRPRAVQDSVVQVGPEDLLSLMIDQIRADEGRVTPVE
ncbi:hypothetical protein [Streptomyces sp. TRM64462]|nr:hypothetical protein [Streptomyces sp. TRM64462]